MIEKIVLNVPYKDKDLVKKLGAKWDMQQKIWYIPPGIDAALFNVWKIASTQKKEYLISHIGLLRSLVICWMCKGRCTVVAFYARKIKQLDDHEFKNGFFVLTELANAPSAVLDFLSLRCPNYKLGKVNRQGEKLYRNHCDHCRTGFSDVKLHKKGNCFHPDNYKDAKIMQIINLLFFDNLVIKSDFMDYSSAISFYDNIIETDYLLDYV